MLLSAVPVLVVAQSSSEIPEGLMNNPVNTEIWHMPVVVLVTLSCRSRVLPGHKDYMKYHYYRYSRRCVYARP